MQTDRVLVRHFATAVVLAVLSLPAADAFAGIDFTLTLNDERVAGGEICFVRLPADGRLQDPRVTFFGSNDVRCLPADNVLDFPNGRFHFFGRHQRGLIGTDRGIVVRTDEHTNRAYRRVNVPLRRAAALDFSDVMQRLAPGEWLGVWSAGTAETRSSFLPLARGAARMVVPSDSVVVPMVIRDRQPVAIGEPLTLAAGRTEKVPPFRSEPGHADVVVWAYTDSDLSARILRKVESPFPRAVVDERVVTTVPAATLIDAKGAVHEPVARFATTDVTGAIQIFRKVPAGTATVRFRGWSWSPDDLVISVGDRERVVFVDEPLLAEPAGVIRFRWLRNGASPNERLEIAVSRCEGEGAATCTIVERKTEPATAEGWVEFGSLAPGNYRIDVAGAAAAHRQAVGVVAGQISTATADWR